MITQQLSFSTNLDITMDKIMWVGLGSGLGGVCRYAIVLWLSPLELLATLLCNGVGSFVMGVLLAYLDRAQGHSVTLYFLGVGILGGFTTFSALAGQNMRMIQSGQWGSAIAYPTLSVFVCLCACALGWGLYNKVIPVT